MLTKRENFLETIKINGAPDRLVNHYEMAKIIRPDPFLMSGHAVLQKGEEGPDPWGSNMAFPEDSPNVVPHPTPENLVIKDIETWKDVLTIPEVSSNPTDWADAKRMVDEVDKNEYMATAFVAPGLFERVHRLMGFENAFITMLEEPEMFKELVDTIAADRLKNIQILVENMHPDMVLSHDDWGTKHSLFMSPGSWREFFKPHYADIYGYFKSEGVVVMHHADSFLEPIIEDMAEIGVDVWQGTLPENDIPKLQEQLAGRMTLMGGTDAGILDRENSTEEEIRTEVRRACAAYGPAGHFIPSVTYGGPDDVIYPHVLPLVQDEIRRYNKEVYGIE